MTATTDSTLLQTIAVQAAEAAGRMILAADPGISADSKGRGDYVSDVDRGAERAIRDHMASTTPDIPVYGEEAGGSKGERYWLVDPLDGTTNFLHGFPVVGVSIALMDQGRPSVAVVHAPMLGETYIAATGMGARLSKPGLPDRPLRVSDRPVERAVVGTGFPFRVRSILPRYLPVMERVLETCEDLRRPGAASLDLAWVAAGVFDGFFELNLSSWDVAAGGLLIQEAGGTVTDWDGTENYLSGNIIAGNPAVHQALLAITSDS